MDQSISMQTLDDNISANAPVASPASPFDALKARIANKTATVGIVGLGYVGLPLADAFLQAGMPVLGFDVDETKIDKLRAGESYIKHISPEKVRTWLAGRRFKATAAAADLDDADAILICVPTPLTEAREPDLHFVTSTARQIAKILRPGQLVVLESTTYPGTTRDVVLPILAATGLTPGRDFFLAYSPEREDPGNPEFYNARASPKWSAATTPRAPSWRKICIAGLCRKSSPFRRVRSPRPARSSKTPTAP